MESAPYLIRSYFDFVHFSSGLVQAAVTILKGFDDTSLTNDKAEDLFEWMGDLAGESLENDTSLKEVRVSLRHF